MNDDHRPKALESHTADYVASAARAALGAVPFIGSLLVEIAGTVIPNQRIDRMARFARQLASRLDDVEQGFVRAQLGNENFTDLMEEGLRQAARAVTDERRRQIAALVANSLTSQDISYVEAKHLLRILGEINDVEVIWLASHQFESFGEGEAFWNRHKEVLEPVAAAMNAPQEEIDKETLQESYKEHLTQLGLLQVRYRMDPRTKQPEFDTWTGAQKVQGHGLSPLGRLLLRQLGVLQEDDEAG